MPAGGLEFTYDVYVPASPQKEVDIEVEAWSEQWGVNLDIPACYISTARGCAPCAAVLLESFLLLLGCGSDFGHRMFARGSAPTSELSLKLAKAEEPMRRCGCKPRTWREHAWLNVH